MKRVSLYLITFFTLGLVANRVLDYWMGYGSSSQDAVMTGGIACMWIAMLAFPALVVTCIVALVKRRDRRWTAGALLATFPVVALLRLAVPHLSVLDGLRDRVAQENSLDDLRHLAQEVDALPTGAEKGSYKSFRHSEVNALKGQLKGQYPFFNWGAGPSDIREQDSIVYVEWGGPMAGYWGFQIGVLGKKPDVAETEKTAGVAALSDDVIVFYMSE